MEKALGRGFDKRTQATAEIEQLARAYRRSGPRESLAAVERLRRTLSAAPPASVVVVGTNGKTSTATYLARLLAACGQRTGLYVSPHLSEWGERVRVDDRPVDLGELLEALRTAVGRAGPPGEADLRFFDLLTLAAESIFAREGVDVAVYEAGIGGRLDAVATLEPDLVLLTGVALDHTEILGESRAEILREKMLAAPPGAVLATLPLGEELAGAATEIAADRDLRLRRVEPGVRRERRAAPELPDALYRALRLAEAGRAILEEEEVVPLGRPSGTIDLWLPGRFECGVHDGVPYVLDVAHNEAAWRSWRRKCAAGSARTSRHA